MPHCQMCAVITASIHLREKGTRSLETLVICAMQSHATSGAIEQVYFCFFSRPDYIRELGLLMMVQRLRALAGYLDGLGRSDCKV